MSDKILPPTTAAVRPAYFDAEFFLNRRTVTAVLCIFLLIGFGLRAFDLSAESLGEDELNKLETVNEYREKGLTGRNGEHPFLMKGMQTVSLSIAGKLNDAFFTTSPTQSSNGFKISDEAALRMPTAVIGTLTILALFLLVREMFGSSLALISAALWAVDPNAVGFDRIGKEDSFLLFFFLLAGFFWLRSQTAAERGKENHAKYLWLAAAASGAMMASKYLPHLALTGVAYFSIIRAVPSTRWRIGKSRWVLFYLIAGVSFLILNPTVLLPDTWQQMLTFSKEQKIAHDSYEFAGRLYENKMTAWTAGVPWYFFYYFILYKTPVLTLIFAVAGLPHLLSKKLGDGRIFVILWAAFWFLPFTFLGGKFTRYFTSAQPLILILAAVGCFFAARRLARRLFSEENRLRAVFIRALPAVLVAASLINSVSVAPHYRLFTNQLAGRSDSRFLFPHDEFYDAGTEAAVLEIAGQGGQPARVAVETPGLFRFYAEKNLIENLSFVPLSDKAQTANLQAGDFIVDVRGRRYFSNEKYLDYLQNASAPVSVIKLGNTTAVKIYRLDAASAEAVRALSKEDSGIRK